LACCPTSIAFTQFFDRYGIPPNISVVIRIVRPKDVISDVKKNTAKMIQTGCGALTEEQLVVNVHISVSEGARWVMAEGLGDQGWKTLNLRCSSRRRSRHIVNRVIVGRGRRSQSLLFKGVLGWIPVIKILVRQIHHALGKSTERRGTLSPAHGKHQGEGNKGFLTWHSGKGNPQCGDALGCHPHPVEAVTDVKLQEVNGTVPWISVVNLVENTIQAIPKLHSLWRSKMDGLIVETPECVVHNGARTSALLWDHSEGCQTKVG
jgi:hypothetical protein